MVDYYHYDFFALPHTHMHTTYSFFFNRRELLTVHFLSQAAYCLAYYPNVRLQTLVQTQQAYLTPFPSMMSNFKSGQGFRGVFSGFTPYLVYWMGDSIMRNNISFGYFNTLAVSLVSGVFYPFELQQIRLASATPSERGLSGGVLKDVIVNYGNSKFWTGFIASVLRNSLLYSSLISSVIFVLLCLSACLFLC